METSTAVSWEWWSVWRRFGRSSVMVRNLNLIYFVWIGFKTAGLLSKMCPCLLIEYDWAALISNYVAEIRCFHGWVLWQQFLYHRCFSSHSMVHCFIEEIEEQMCKKMLGSSRVFHNCNTTLSTRKANVDYFVNKRQYIALDLFIHSTDLDRDLLSPSTNPCDPQLVASTWK